MPARFILLLVVLLVFTVMPSIIELATEWLWFNEVAYDGIFTRTLTAKATMGSVVFFLAFGCLSMNLRLALKRFTRPYMLFPGGGDIQPVVLEPRQLKMLTRAIATLLSLFLALFSFCFSGSSLVLAAFPLA